MATIHTLHTLTPPPQRTVNDLLTAYARDYLPLKATTTQYQEGRMLAWIARDLGHLALPTLTSLVLKTWLHSLQGHYKPHSIRRFRNALSAALTGAVRDYEWLERHPLRKVPQLPTPPFRERCLDGTELRRLLAACQCSRHPHLFPVVVVALSTGCRKNELLQRQWREVDLDRGLLAIPLSKNGTRRAVPLIPQAIAILRQQHATVGSSPWLFPRRDGQKPCFIDAAWWTACARAGVTDLHFHDLRHCCASYLAMSGATLHDIAAILGHKDMTMSMRYSHLSDSHMHGVVQHMAETFLGASPVPTPALPPVPAPGPLDVGQAAAHLLHEASTPPLSIELQILDIVRALAPLPASAIQVAGLVHLPIARVRDILQQWAQRGTLVRISKGYYRYQGDTR